MNNHIDHILWATPDFEEGVAMMHELSGVRPDYGGPHPGLGTQNALLALGSRVYLEILGPDSKQNLEGTFGGTIAALGKPGILTLAARTQDIQAAAARARDAGLTAAEPMAMTRRTEDGRVLQWRVMLLKDEEYGWSIPFFIDWGDAPHPADTAAPGCQLVSCKIMHPNGARLSRILGALDIPIAVTKSETAGFVAELNTPKGRLNLTGS